jgi:hypothetical protein
MMRRPSVKDQNSLALVMALFAGFIFLASLQKCSESYSENTCIRTCHPDTLHISKGKTCVCLDAEGNPILKEVE